jgi:hypothetical protein
MTDHANRLWELLGELGARPEQIIPPNERDWWAWKQSGSAFVSPMFKSQALAILCNAARRACDDRELVFENDGGCPIYTIRTSGQIREDIGEYLILPEDDMDYESALIASLEWIIEQRKPSNPES